MLYKFDFLSHKLYENDKELNVTSVILGRFEGSEETKEAIILEQDDKALYNLFLDNSGNYAKVGFDENGVFSIISSACINIYYYINDKTVYFSNLMIDIENLAANINMIDLDSVYYYIASGNYPPVENTFWKSIRKVSGEHHVVISNGGGVQDKKWTFKLPDKKIINKKNEYEEIMNFEAIGLKNWLHTLGKKPYCLISGVDSFNSFLALKNVGVHPLAIHANVHELQNCYVREFIKEYDDTNYTEVTRDFYKCSAQTIIKSYKESINPFFKMSIDTPINNMVYEKEGSNAVEITGDFTGLSMAIKAFNSTLNQHSFWGRHFLGAMKRSYYSDSKLMKANEQFGKKNSLYNFMLSMFMPTENFDALVPFTAIKKAAGLSEVETKVFVEVVKKYIDSYASSVNWNLSRIYNDNVGKLFRSFKREFYMAGLPTYNEANNHLYGIEHLSLFSSNRASVFEDNYSLDFYNDIYRSKKCVYDYFDAHHPVDMITMAKKAYNAFKKGRRISLKGCLAKLILYPIRFVPSSAKNNDIYQKLKRKFSFLTKEAGGNTHTAGAITFTKDDASDFIIFSSKCEDAVMKRYFEKLEKAISGKDMMDYSSVEERYVALSVYMKERVRNSQL